MINFINLKKYVYDENDVDYDELTQDIHESLQRKAEEFWKAGIIIFEDEDSYKT